MRVRVLFFAIVRDTAGTDEAQFELPEGATVAALLAAVSERFGPEATPGNLAVAINQEYASRDASLQDGDLVALIPPVAGG
jgi:molybdopterin converting factor subunit 1